MRVPRRSFLHMVGAAIALGGLPQAARAQTYPSQPVRCIVGYAPGGGTDIFVRLVGQLLPARLGQPFIIENRPGASTNIATDAVVRAPADGYTLLGTDAAASINATLYEKLSFNFIRDFAMVGITRGPLVVAVHPSIPVKTIPELIAYAKANPGKLAMASSGSGSTNHLAGELFKAITKIDMTHVPYRGAGPATTDLLGGQVQIMFIALPPSLEHIRAGRLRALAVTTTTRFEALPDVPPASDFVPGYVASQWWGMSVRKGTPLEVVYRLNKEVNAILAENQFKARLADLGSEVLAGSSDELGAFVAADTENWAKAVKFSGAKPD
jgi:tripartite-type tricarboxylate transporter receptor subunit TctC